MKTSRLVIQFASLLIISLNLISCSVYMASKQPDKKDLSVLNEGTPRSHVIAEIGAPILSEKTEDGRTDVYKFVQGYSSGAKAGRAFFHGAADVLTVGLWEIVGTPIEGVADGTEVKLEVHYDAEDKVQKVTALSGEDAVYDSNNTSVSKTKQ